MKRIAIIGLPGSGKSTFALKFGQKLDIPVHHLDKYVFNGKVKRNNEEYLKIKESILKEETWIIEGCSFSALEKRFACADHVIYFSFPRWLCIWRVCKRVFSKDLETGCLNGINWQLLKYIWNFKENKYPAIAELCKRYPAVEFTTFQSSQEAEAHLIKWNEK